MDGHDHCAMVKSAPLCVSCVQKPILIVHINGSTRCNVKHAWWIPTCVWLSLHVNKMWQLLWGRSRSITHMSLLTFSYLHMSGRLNPHVGTLLSITACVYLTTLYTWFYEASMILNLSHKALLVYNKHHSVCSLYYDIYTRVLWLSHVCTIPGKQKLCV